jgi:hypothetical protein
MSLMSFGSFYRDEPTSIPSNQNDIASTGGIIGAPAALQVLSDSFVNYATGEFRLNFTAPATGDVTVTYEHVDEEWPYFAARIDLEIRLNVAPDPPPPVDTALVEGLLTRLEEVRPIHVLLRAFALVVELADEMSPTATDAHSPTRHALYEYEVVVFEIADIGPDAASGDVYEDAADSTRKFQVIRDKVSGDGATQLTTVQLAGTDPFTGAGTLTLDVGVGDPSIPWTSSVVANRQNHFLLDVSPLADDVILLEEIGATHDTILQIDERVPIVSILDSVIINAGGFVQHV